MLLRGSRTAIYLPQVMFGLSSIEVVESAPFCSSPRFGVPG